MMSVAYSACCVLQLYFIANRPHRTAALRRFTQFPVHALDPQLVGDLLRSFKILDIGERVVVLLKFDFLLFQLLRQPIVSVPIHLQPKRRPRRNSYVAKPQLGILKVKVVVCQRKVEMSYFGEVAMLISSPPFPPCPLSRTVLAVKGSLRRATTARP